MTNPVTDSPSHAEEYPPQGVIPPSEALSRFEPPEGFVPVAVEMTSNRLRYGFHSAGLALLIREGVGSEVVPMMPFATIPNGPVWLTGVINLRGNLVPVCDLRRVLGTSGGSETAKRMILVLDKGDKAAGFVIDGYPRALTIQGRTLEVNGLPDALASHLRAALSSDEEVWLEFDHEGFLESAIRQ